MKNKYIKGGIEFYIYSEFTNMCAMNYSKISAFKFWGLCVLLMFTMSAQAQFDPEPLLHIHSDFEDTTFNNRRVRHVDLEAKIIQLKTIPGFEVKLLGKSFLGRNIHLVKVGQGDTKVLLWSQMHGDESTATMAILDLFNFFTTTGRWSGLKENILDECTLYFIPMLNPDGAELFVRRNAQQIDINRDAIYLQSPEARILKSVRDSLQPDFGFNLHDQHKYHAAGDQKTPASISLLAPAYNQEKEVNAVREHAMQVAGVIHNTLKKIIPMHIGRYDDEHEPRAFGDNIQKWGTSTILIETGAFENDPEKQFLRKVNFIALLSALESISNKAYYSVDLQDYWSIPENKNRLNDFIIKNITMEDHGVQYLTDISYNRSEFSGLASIQDMGDLSVYKGYAEWDGTGKRLVSGKLYPALIKNLKKLDKLDLDNLLHQGYTEVRLKKVPTTKSKDTSLISILKINETKNNTFMPGSNPNALIYQGEKLIFLLKNGNLISIAN